MNYNALLYINEIFRNFEHAFANNMFLFLFYLLCSCFFSIYSTQNFYQLPTWLEIYDADS